MQPYLSQLTADLRSRHHQQPPPVDYRLLHPEYADVPDEMKYVVAWEQAPEMPFPELFGIPAEAFPPPHLLTDAQMAALVAEILALWEAWHIYADLPPGVPIANQYQVITHYWRTETIHYISEGQLHLEFCHYDPQACPWPEAYCQCKNH